MAPAVAHVTAQLRQLIYYYLDNNLVKNALFLAGRLVAYDPRSTEAAYLLAYCQYQGGFVKAAWETSGAAALRGSHLGCSYVFAQASLDLGRFLDGLTALDKSKHLWQTRNSWGQHHETRRQHLPDAAAVLCLKGKLWKAHRNIPEAVECWAAALKLNPFMWDAFLGICDAGAKVSIPNIYKMSAEMIAMVHAAQQQLARSEQATAAMSERSTTSSQPPHAHGNADPFVSTRANPHTQPANSVLWEKLNGSKISINTASTVLDDEAFETPVADAKMDDVVLPGIRDAPPALSRKAKSATEIPADPPPKFKAVSTRMKAKAKGLSDDTTVLQDPPPPTAPSKRNVSGHPTAAAHAPSNTAEGTRRSNRLLNTVKPPMASNTAGSKISSLANSLGLREGRDIKKAKAPVPRTRTANASTVGRVVSGNRTKTGSADTMDVDSKDHRGSATAPPVPPLPNPKTRIDAAVTKDLEALQMLLDLFGRMASAQLSLSNYDSRVALQTYTSLPFAQRETPYIMAQMGKAHYEQAQYADAETFFMRVRDMAPTRLEDMEVYSTVLWHLKSDVELAYLAHELIAIDRLSPQAWCAIGNAFSLQREPEQALKCFKRSTQLDPRYAYGFTLQGHEYIANEEFEKALEAYRAAIAADGRHYNAWYGLGKVYEKLGKWAIAEQHYRTAASINPTNAVLICCIGLVLERMGEPEKALQMYTRACSLAPTSAVTRFKKARCIMSLGQPREALTELLILKDVAPDEANVWFFMGRLYKSLGEKANAVRAFTMALNLDPKAAQFIKDAMESLDEEDDDGFDDDADME